MPKYSIVLRLRNQFAITALGSSFMSCQIGQRNIIIPIDSDNCNIGIFNCNLCHCFRYGVYANTQSYTFSLTYSVFSLNYVFFLLVSIDKNIYHTLNSC